jgi:hypothetical protein
VEVIPFTSNRGNEAIQPQSPKMSRTRNTRDRPP